MPDLQPEDRVERFEVIDHRAGSPTFGRAMVCYGVKVTLARQDGGTTLKVFLDDRKEAVATAGEGVIGHFLKNMLGAAAPGGGPPFVHLLTHPAPEECSFCYDPAACRYGYSPADNRYACNTHDPARSAVWAPAVTDTGFHYTRPWPPVPVTHTITTTP